MSQIFNDSLFNMGILGSPWIGFSNFEDLWIEQDFWNSFFNTLRISAVNIVAGFFAPLILALLFNELVSLSIRYGFA
jgi:putative aldouronate transport system permease protein